MPHLSTGLSSKLHKPSNFRFLSSSRLWGAKSDAAVSPSTSTSDTCPPHSLRLNCPPGPRPLQPNENLFRLPPEILCDIFFIVVDEAHTEAGRPRVYLAFSQVCSLWREVALAEHRLWATLVLEYPKLVPLMVQRARGIPLHIKARLSVHQNKLIEDVIRRGLSIRILELGRCPSNSILLRSQPMSCLTRPIHNLQHLVLDSARDPCMLRLRVLDCALLSPSLRSIHLNNWFLKGLPPLLHNLVELSIVNSEETRIDVNHLVAILNRTPGLRKLCSEHILKTASSQSPLEAPLGQAELPHLTEIRAVTKDSLSATVLLDCLKLSAPTIDVFFEFDWSIDSGDVERLSDRFARSQHLGRLVRFRLAPKARLDMPKPVHDLRLETVEYPASEETCGMVFPFLSESSCITDYLHLRCRPSLHILCDETWPQTLSMIPEDIFFLGVDSGLALEAATMLGISRKGMVFNMTFRHVDPADAEEFVAYLSKHLRRNCVDTKDLTTVTFDSCSVASKDQLTQALIKYGVGDWVKEIVFKDDQDLSYSSQIRGILQG